MRNQALRLWFVFGARLRLALAVCCLSSSVPYDISFLPFPSNEQAYEFRGVCFRISRNALEDFELDGEYQQRLPSKETIQFNSIDQAIQPASTLGLSTNPQHQDQFEINAIDQAIQAASTLDSSCPFN